MRILSIGIVTAALMMGATTASASPIQFSFDLGASGQLTFELPDYPTATFVNQAFSPSVETYLDATLAEVDYAVCGSQSVWLFTQAGGVSNVDGCGLTAQSGDLGFGIRGPLNLTAPGPYSYDPFLIIGSGPFVSGTLTVSDLGTTAAVPEPATLSLLGLGLAGAGVRRWRQRKQA